MSSNVLKGLAVDGWKLHQPSLEKKEYGFDLACCAASVAGEASCPLFSEKGEVQENAWLQGQRAEIEKERLQTLEDAQREGEKIKEEAWHEGYSAALQKGQSESRIMLDQAEKILQEAQRERLIIIKGAEGEILQIAVSIAEKLLHCKIILDKNAVLAVFKKALETLPGGRNVILSVNSLDEAVCRESLKQLQEQLSKGSSLKVVGSPAIDRGSCKVESEEAEIGIILQTELETLANKLLALAGES